MNSASSAVENGMNTTASRNTRWIHVSRWSLRAKKLSWVCWPAQKMPSVKELIRYVSRCGPNGTSAFQTVASDARAPGAQIGCCECVAMPTLGMTMLSTSNVIATAKIQTLDRSRRAEVLSELPAWLRDADSWHSRAVMAIALKLRDRQLLEAAVREAKTLGVHDLAGGKE